QRPGLRVGEPGREPASRCGLAHHVEAVFATLERLDRKPVLGQEQRVATDAAAEIWQGRSAAVPHLWQELDNGRGREEPICATVFGLPSFVPGIDRRADR